MSRRLQWGLPEAPPPKHPYRDTLIVYGALAILIVRRRLADQRRGGEGRRHRGVLLRRRLGVERLPLAQPAAGGGRGARAPEEAEL